MSIKKVIVIVVVFLYNLVYSQNNGFYKFTSDVKVTEIEFSIPQNHRYRLDKTHTLIKVSFYLINDTCCVKKYYSDDKEVQLSDENLLNRKYYNQFDLKLDKQIFYDLIESIQIVNFETCNKPENNVFDGFTYGLSFGNYYVQFNYLFYGLSHNKSNDGILLYKLFEDIWEKYQ